MEVAIAEALHSMCKDYGEQRRQAIIRRKQSLFHQLLHKMKECAIMSESWTPFLQSTIVVVVY